MFAAVRTGPGGFRRAVALKRLIDDDAVRGASVQRFLAEARILSSLHHPNVIEVYDVLAADRGYVLVMELLTGATLNKIVRARGADDRLAADEICALADQALAGLAYIHAARDDSGRPLGLIHRDLTPNNLFVTEAGEVKLIDFGIAKLRDALDAPVTRDGEIHGTLELIAPEQARGDPADPRTDLYQLAGSLYWALTGRYPHGTGTTVELVTRAAMLAPTPLAELRPDLPAVLIATIDRAMALEPADRFSDAAAMRAALRELVPGDPEAGLAACVRACAGEVEHAATQPEAEAERPTPTPDTTPPTVQERPSARRAEQPVGPTPRRRRWPLVAAISGGLALAGGSALLVIDRGETTHEVTPDPARLPIVPGTEGAISATPLGNGRLAFATERGVTSIAERGGEARAIELPPNSTLVDVQPLQGGRVAMTVQGTDGPLLTYAEGALAQKLVEQIRPGVIAVRPDGAVVAEAERWLSAFLVGSEQRELLPIHSGRDLVSALAWAPDGGRLAAIYEPWGTDPLIEIVDGRTRATTKWAHAPIGGDIAAFGWLDTDHLAFAVNRDDGATLYKLDVGSQREQEIARLPGERVVAGHTAAGAIALLHGVAKHTLLLGTARELRAVPVDAAAAVAGIDAAARVVFARPDGTIVSRAPNGNVAPWPGALDHDRPVAIVDGELLVLRDNALHRLGGAVTTRMITPTAPRGTAPIRCAGDATTPCVVAVSDSVGISYYTQDPQGTARPDTYLTSLRGLDHALSRDGTQLAIVNGTQEIRVVDLVHHKSQYRKPGWGTACEHVAWIGDELVVSARNWRQHPWALLAIDAESHVRLIAESRVRISAQLRASGDTLAVAATDVTPVLSVLHP